MMISDLTSEYASFIFVHNNSFNKEDPNMNLTNLEIVL